MQNHYRRYDGGCKASGLDLLENAADKPGKGEYGDDAHAKHELQSLPLRVRKRSAAYRTSPIYHVTSQSTALRVMGVCFAKNLPDNGVYFCGMYMPKVKSSDTPSLPADATSVIAS